MKTIWLVVLCGSFAVGANTAHAAGTSPKVPAASASDTREFSSAACRVNFDAAGNKTAVMTKSTGSKTFDAKVQRVALTSINGFKDTNLPVYFSCKTVEVPTARGKVKVMVAASRPPYPYQARARNEQGDGLVKVSFDENGRATGAIMAQSTGSKILDRSTANYAYAHWISSGGAKLVTTIPAAYRMP